MKRVTIETSWSNSFVQAELADVERDLESEGGALVIVAPKAPGFFEEFAISVVGGVAVHVIGKLIDVITKKIDPDRKARITITDRDAGRSFTLPGQLNEARRHFGLPQSHEVEGRPKPESREEARIYIPDDFDIANVEAFVPGSAAAFAQYNEHLQAVLARGGVSYEPHEAARAQLAVLIHYCRQKELPLQWGFLMKTMLEWIRDDPEAVNVYDSAKNLIALLLEKQRKPEI